MKLISEFNDYVYPVIVEENEKGRKRILHRRSLHAI